MDEEIQKFLEKFNISEADFKAAGIEWNSLQAIKKDYKKLRKELNLIANYIGDKLEAQSAVHSVRSRLKNPEHLMAKIIRKKIKYPKRDITLENYRSLITDLVGVRVIHLFKEDWMYIHEFIKNTWDLHETPIAYIREGDSGSHIQKYAESEFKIEAHPYGYRSVHYTVESKPSKERYLAEIQVRTIFEEGWSEIDHTIKYAKNVEDPLLDKFLDTFNVLAGNSDQMGSFVRNLKNDLLKGTETIEMYEKLTEENVGIITSLKRRVAGTIGELNSKITIVEAKIYALQKAERNTEPFKKVLEKAKVSASRFEDSLTHDPRKATKIFESTAKELKRLDVLLEVMLASVKHLHDNHKDEASFQKEHLVNFYTNLQALSEVEDSVRKVTENHFKNADEWHRHLEPAVKSISSQGTLHKFVMGTKQRDERVLQDEIIKNDTRISALEDSLRSVQDSAVRSVLEMQIELFALQNKKLRDFVKKHHTPISLFGWLSRLP